VIEDASPVVRNASKNFLSDAPTYEVQYQYNANGAMNQDLNKGITSIAYNYLNLPAQMEMNASSSEARTRYTYSASGQKLRVHYKWDSNREEQPLTGSNLNAIIGTAPNEANMDKELTIDYAANFIYENNVLKTII